MAHATNAASSAGSGACVRGSSTFGRTSLAGLSAQRPRSIPWKKRFDRSAFSWLARDGAAARSTRM